jgi:hypothetical protein
LNDDQKGISPVKKQMSIRHSRAKDEKVDRSIFFVEQLRSLFIEKLTRTTKGAAIDV